MIMNLILEENTMFETLKNILVEELQLDPEEIKPEAELTNDLGINSIELADLVLMCEDKFGVEIDDDDIQQFVTIADVVKYLEANAK
jgi:acyl carrier protein